MTTLSVAYGVQSAPLRENRSMIVTCQITLLYVIIGGLLFLCDNVIAENNTESSTGTVTEEITQHDESMESEFSDVSFDDENSEDFEFDAMDEDFGDLSLESLMEIEVISVTRTAGQNLLTSPAAIYVITQDEIRRSGHKSLPELLRLVPGMQVARIDANKWAVASRGFNQRFNRNLLVQLDGRTLYTPSFSGVIWSMHDVVLEDVDRIEVIRGPGASLWGANAVNGIINIVTKSAEETQGLLITGGVGSSEQGSATVRWGDQLSENTFYRTYFKTRQSEHYDPFPGSPDYSDEMRQFQGGFRIDIDNGEGNTFTVHGDAYDMYAGESIKYVDVLNGGTFDINGNHHMQGANILSRFTRHISEDSNFQFQIYYDWAKWKIPYPGADFQQEIGQFDIDFQHSFRLMENHHVVWGLGYRNTAAKYQFGGIIGGLKEEPELHSFSGFIQNAMTFVPDTLDFIIGTKIEHNEFTHLELQPSARLVYTPNKRNTIWGGISRAVRTPSLVENDGIITIGTLIPGFPVQMIGNPDLDAESVITCELGYRVKPCEYVYMDMTGFYNDYSELTTYEFISPLTLVWGNIQSAESYGFEITTTWQPVDNWRIVGNYTGIEMEYDRDGVDDIAIDIPQHQLSLRSYLDLTDDLEFNAALYYSDNISNQDLNARTRLDLGLVWRPQSNLEIGIWGQNLLDNKHVEFGPDSFLTRGGTEVERSIFVQVTLQF